MDDDELDRLTPQQAASLAQRVASRSNAHALAVLEGTALALVRPDRKHRRELQQVAGASMAFTTRLIDAIGMLRSVVGRKVIGDHKVTADEQMQ